MREHNTQLAVELQLGKGYFTKCSRNDHPGQSLYMELHV
jgi:hypothetical protein